LPEVGPPLVPARDAAPPPARQERSGPPTDWETTPGLAAWCRASPADGLRRGVSLNCRPLNPPEDGARGALESPYRFPHPYRPSASSIRIRAMRSSSVRLATSFASSDIAGDGCSTSTAPESAAPDGRTVGFSEETLEGSNPSGCIPPRLRFPNSPFP